MRLASWIVLALLPTLAACGVRYHGSYGGSSFTSGVGGHVNGKHVSYGTLHGDCSRYGVSANCDQATMDFHPDHDPKDFELVVRVFQDLDGNEVYSEGVDRMLAVSTPGRVAGQELSLDRIQFNFRPHHEPIAMSFELMKDGEVIYQRGEGF